MASASCGNSRASFPLGEHGGRVWFLAISALLSSCASATPAESTQQPATSPGETSKSPSAPRSRERPVAVPAPRPLEDGRTLDLVASSDLLGDFPERLSPQQARSRALILAHPQVAWVSLDEHRPRPALGRKLTLVDLLNEDEEVAPGFHHLVVFELEEQRLVHQSQFFSYEVASSGLPLAPGCALLFPGGTYNGPRQTARIELLALPLQAGIDRIEYRVEAGEFRAEGTYPVGKTAVVAQPPSGDLRVSATCFVGEEALPGESRIVTVNRDAPDPESKEAP